MQNTHERSSPGSQKPWRSRAAVLSVITVAYGALFYGIAHMRTPRDSVTDGSPMFTPIVSKLGEQRDGITESKPRRRREQEEAEQQGQLTPPPRHWSFSPVDLSPSALGWTATLSEFTPVTEATPDPSEMQALLPLGQPPPKSAPRVSILRMARWFRPAYDAAQCDALPADSLLVLDLRIAPRGQPVEIKIEQSSGSQQLDDTAQRAAALWRFAPPLWKSQPVEVWGRIGLRFNC